MRDCRSSSRQEQPARAPVNSPDPQWGLLVAYMAAGWQDGWEDRDFLGFLLIRFAVVVGVRADGDAWSAAGARFFLRGCRACLREFFHQHYQAHETTPNGFPSASGRRQRLKASSRNKNRAHCGKITVPQSS